MDGAVDELPVGRRAMRLLIHVVPRGAVGGDGGQRDDQVAELEVVLEPAAGADAKETLDAELDELLHDDRRGRAAHAVACTETGFPWYSPVYPSSPRSAFFCTGLSK